METKNDRGRKAKEVRKRLEESRARERGWVGEREGERGSQREGEGVKSELTKTK